MPIKDPIIVLGLTGEIDTITPRREALEEAGYTHIRYAEVTPGMTAVEQHNALVALAKGIRQSQPDARFLVFEKSLRPMMGAAPMVDGALSCGDAGMRTAAEIKQAVAEWHAREAELARQDHDTHGHGPLMPSFHSVTRQSPEPIKPKILVLYYQPCNGKGIISNAKAEVTHAMVVPKDLDHISFLTEGDAPKLNAELLTTRQSSRRAKPAFLKEMQAIFGEKFWSDKKFDTAIASVEELQSMLKNGGYDGVVVVGNATRQDYALLPENVGDIVQQTALDKTPHIARVHGNDAIVTNARDALNEMVHNCMKAATTPPSPQDVVQHELEKAAKTNGLAFARSTPRKPLQRTYPRPPRSRNNHPHVLVLYAPGIADAQISDGAAGIDADKAVLVDDALAGAFVKPCGAIHPNALRKAQEPPVFITDLQARFGEGFQRHITATFAKAEQFTEYLGKRRPHGSARATKAYDEIVLVGTIPEGFSISEDAICAACNAHTGNHDGKPCVFSKVSTVEELRERFPAETIEQSLGIV